MRPSGHELALHAAIDHYALTDPFTMLPPHPFQRPNMLESHNRTRARPSPHTHHLIRWCLKRGLLTPVMSRTLHSKGDSSREMEMTCNYATPTLVSTACTATMPHPSSCVRYYLGDR